MIKMGKIRPSLNEFKVYFNEKARSIRPELLIQKIEINNSNNHTLFLIQLSATDAIVGSISKIDGAIKQVAILRANDGSSKTRFEFIVATTLFLEALKPNMALKEKSRIFESLCFFKEGFDLYNAKITTVIEDVEFMLLSSIKSGFFSICITFL